MQQIGVPLVWYFQQRSTTQASWRLAQEAFRGNSWEVLLLLVFHMVTVQRFTDLETDVELRR